jgi:hypothetical protein
MGHKKKKKKKRRKPTPDGVQIDAGSGTATAEPTEEEEKWERTLLEEADLYETLHSELQEMLPEGAQTRESVPHSPPTIGGIEHTPVGSTSPVRRGLWYYGKRVLIGLVVVGVIVWAIGEVQRQGVPDLFHWLPLARAPDLQIVDACDNYVLMLETDHEHSQVLVQTSPQESWLRVSRDDSRAVNPAFSPIINSTIKYVAYLSLEGEKRIVVAPLDDTADRIEITSAKLEATGVTDGIPEVAFCEWTPLAWDPEGRRLAFYGCRKQKPHSLVFVAQIDADPVELETIDDTQADTTDQRQLEWSGSDDIVLTMPLPRGNQVETLPVP